MAQRRKRNDDLKYRDSVTSCEFEDTFKAELDKLKMS